MEFLNEWITNIIIFILLAVVVEMLLPQTSLQKYVKLILGLLLIVIILKPLFAIFSMDENTLLKVAEQFPENHQTLEKSIEKKKLEIQAEQAAYILEQTAVQLKEISEQGLYEQFGYRFSDLQIEINDYKFVDSLAMAMEQIEAIKVFLKLEEDSLVEAVKEIIIDTRETVQKDGKNEDIAKYLAKQWEVDPSIIEIFIEKEAGKNG